LIIYDHQFGSLCAVAIILRAISRGEMRLRTGPVSTVPGYVVYH